MQKQIVLTLEESFDIKMDGHLSMVMDTVTITIGINTLFNIHRFNKNLKLRIKHLEEH